MLRRTATVDNAQLLSATHAKRKTFCSEFHRNNLIYKLRHVFDYLSSPTVYSEEHMPIDPSQVTRFA